MWSVLRLQRRVGSNGRPPPQATRARTVIRRQNNVRNHLMVMITTTASCLLIIGFLVYDQYQIYKFQSEQNEIWGGDIHVAENRNSTQEDIGGILSKYQSYTRQRALSATLIVLILLLIVSGVGVYIGYEKKLKILLIGYLVLTFPVMTFSMVYAIIFMVDASSTYVYIKIVTVIFVYTVQANMYRLVYRLYQTLKYNARRAERRAETNEGAEHQADNREPVIIQMKPPPYEKEPPPYSVEIPNIHTSSSFRYNQTFGLAESGVNPSSFDFGPETVEYNNTNHDQSFNAPELNVIRENNTSGVIAVVSSRNSANIYGISDSLNASNVNANRESTTSRPCTISVLERTADDDNNDSNASPLAGYALMPVIAANANSYSSVDMPPPPPYS